MAGIQERGRSRTTLRRRATTKIKKINKIKEANMGFTKSMFVFGTAKEGDSFEFLFPYEGDQPILGYKPWCNCISEVKITERGVEGVIKPEFTNEQKDGNKYHQYRRSLSVYVDDGNPYWSFDPDGKLIERQPVFLNIEGYLDMDSKED